MATIVHLRVPSTACDQLPPLRALRAFVRTHYLSSKPVVLIYAYHPACPQEVGAAYFEQMFNFKWQLNTTTTPLGYKLTANAKHRSDSKEGGSAPVLEGGGDLYYDQDRLLCAMVRYAVQVFFFLSFVPSLVGHHHFANREKQFITYT